MVFKSEPEDKKNYVLNPRDMYNLETADSNHFDFLWKEVICFFPEVPYWNPKRAEKAKDFARRVYALTKQGK